MRTVTTGSARTLRGRAALAPRRRAGARRQQLLQACFTSLGVGAVVLTSAFMSPFAPTPDGGSTQSSDTAPLWSASWSQRFPGCVAMVLWPEGEPPVALVTLSPDGSVHRLAVDSARRVPLGDRVVGACR